MFLWRMFLTASSIIPATIVARRIAISAATTVCMAGGPPSSMFTEPTNVQIAGNTKTREVCLQPLSAHECLQEKNHPAVKRMDPANPA